MRAHRGAAALVLIVSLLLVSTGGPAEAQPAGTPHIPDLITAVPSSFRITGAPKGQPGGTKRLFFSNTIGNQGQGPLELRAVNNAGTETTEAWQEIYTHTGSGTGPKSRLTMLSESHVGTFVFHPLHNHWHMGDFAQYDLRAINTDGSTGAILRSTDKVSFCMLDTTTMFPTIDHFGMGLAHSCGANARQGLKVGMGDTYSSSLPDQFIDITALPNGTYRLVTTADPNMDPHPNGQLIELNDHNNTATVDVTIAGNAVTVVAGSGTTGVDQPALTAADLQQRALDRQARSSQLVCIL